MVVPGEFGGDVYLIDGRDSSNVGVGDSGIGAGAAHMSSFALALVVVLKLGAGAAHMSVFAVVVSHAIDWIGW